MYGLLKNDLWTISIACPNLIDCLLFRYLGWASVLSV
jgi:hypothetical protein